MPTAAELIFKISQQGLSELDKVNAVVKTVGEGTRLAGAQLKTFDSTLQALVGTGKTYRQALDQMAQSNGVLSQGIIGTAKALLDQTAAVKPAVAQVENLTAATHQLVGANVAASGAIRVFEGNLPIRAVENFATKILGLGPLLQTIFPLVGAIAVGEMLGRLIEKTIDWANAHNPVIQAQKTSLALLQKEGAEYDKLAVKARARALDQYQQQFGKQARDRLDAGDYTRASKEEDADKIRQLQAEINAVTRLAGATTTVPEQTAAQRALGVPPHAQYSTMAFSSDATLAGRIKHTLGLDPGFESGYFGGSYKAPIGLEGLVPGSGVKSETANAARDLLPGLNVALETAQKQQSESQGTASDLNAKGDHLDEKKYDGERREVDALLERAQEKQLSGLEKIGQEREHDLARLGRTADLVRDIERAYDGLYSKEQTREVERGNKVGVTLKERSDKILQNFERTKEESDSLGTRPEDISERDFKPLRAVGLDFEGKDKTVTTPLLGAYNATTKQATSQDLIKSTQEQARQAEALARVQGDPRDKEAAEQRIGDIRTGAVLRVLGLELNIAATKGSQAEKDQAAEDARFTAASKLFDIQVQNIERLDQLQDAQNAKDRSVAEELANIAMSRDPSRGMHQFGMQQAHSLAAGVAGNMFGGLVGNVLNPVSQAANAAGLGDIFKGTILDRTKGDSGKQTADNTLRIANRLDSMAGVEPGTPATAPGGGPGGVGIPGGGGSAGILSSLRSLFSPGGSSSSVAPGGIDSAWTSANWTTLPGEQANDPLAQPLTSPTASAPSGAGGGFSAQSMLANVGAVAGGALAAYQGFKKGGVSGDMQGAGGVLDTAAGIAAMIPGGQLVAGILGAAGAVTGMIGSMLGTGPDQRSRQIFNDLGQNQYLAPTAWNVSESGNGTYSDIGDRGQLRTSSMSAIPTVAEPYETTNVINGQRSYYGVPGNTIAPFSGGAKGSGQTPTSNAPTVIIQAMDAQSFVEFAQKNNAAIGGAVTTHLQNSGEQLAAAIRYHA